MAKDDPTFTGPKAIDAALEKGQDPNADLANLNEDSDQKAEAALALKIQGAPWGKIADIVGYSSGTRARLSVERVLAASNDAADSKSTMRALMDRRYSRLLVSVMPKAVDPDNPDHLPYNARALAILDRMTKLHGIDAPQQVNITATDERINEVLDLVRKTADVQKVDQEGDIWDGEIINQEEVAEDSDA